MSFSLLVACGAEEEAKEEAKGVAAGACIFGTCVKGDDGSISGTGGYKLESGLATREAAKGFALSASLPRVNSKITLVLFSSRDTDLADGVQLTLTRSGGAVNGTIKINNAAAQSIKASKLAHLNPDKLELVVDFYGQGTNGVRTIMYHFSEPSANNLFFDSTRGSDFDSGNPLPVEPLNGVLMGVIINDAAVKTLNAQDPVKL